MVLTLLAAISAPWSASAADPLILGTAGQYSVLGGQTVTSAGTSILSSSLGVSPGTAITGFPPGQIGGATNVGNAAALQAQSDLALAYDEAAGRAPTASVAGDLVGRTFFEGVYNASGPLGLTGTVTLDAQGNPNAVFIFQVASTLITGSASEVALINGARACNVYWQVAESATLGTNSSFKGSILALTSITVTTNTTVEGRALARNGAVTLDGNSFVTETCGIVPTESPSPTATPTVTASPTPTPTVTASPTPTPTVTASPTPTPTVTASPTPTPTVTASPTPTPTGPPALQPIPLTTTPVAPGSDTDGTSDLPGDVNGGADDGGSGGANTGTGGTGTGDGTSLGTNRGTNVQTSVAEPETRGYLTSMILLSGALGCGVLAASAFRQDRPTRTVRQTRRH